MNVLESFYYLFESDTSKLEEGVKRSEKTTEGLKKQLDATDKTANALGASFLGMARAAGVAVAGLVSYTALSALVTNVTASVDALGDQAQALGVNITELELMDAAAAEAGGQIGAFATSLRTFNERVQDVAMRGTPELVKMLDKVGVSLDTVKNKASDPIALLREMAEGIGDISQAEAVAIGKKLGLDEGTVNLLRRGRMGLEEAIAAQRRLGYVTEDQAELAARYNDTIDRGRRVWDDLRRQVVFAVVPLFERMASLWEKSGVLAREHGGAIKWALSAIAVAASALLAPALLRAAAAAWALVAPFAMTAAVVLGVGAAIALLADDLYNFQVGNDSVTGRIVERWPIVGTVIKAAGEVGVVALETLAASADALLTLLSGDRAGAVEGFGARIQALADDIESRYPAFEGLSDIVSANVDFFTEANAGLDEVLQSFFAIIHGRSDLVSDRLGALGSVFRGLATLMRTQMNLLSAVWDAVTAAIGRAITAAQTFREAGMPSLGGAVTAPARALIGLARNALSPSATPAVGAMSSGATMAGAISNSRSSSVTVGEVNVQTQATDAQGIAAGIGSALDRQLRSAADQADDGVLA